MEHPVAGGKRQRVKVTLLSPAQRPIQVTTDIPGFWQGSQFEVGKEMRVADPK